jgi:hypothetical protein
MVDAPITGRLRLVDRYFNQGFSQFWQVLTDLKAGRAALILHELR